MTRRRFLAPAAALVCALAGLVAPATAWGDVAPPNQARGFHAAIGKSGGLAGVEAEGTHGVPLAAPGWNRTTGIDFGLQSFSGTVTNEQSGLSYTCAADGDALSIASTSISSGDMKPARQLSLLKVSGYTPKGVTPVRGEVSDAGKLGQIAYIAATADEIPEGIPGEVEAAGREAAIARVAGVYQNSVWDLAARGKLSLANGSALKPAADRSAQIQAAAEKYAGPYRVDISLHLEDDEKTGHISGIGLTSHTGNWLDGKQFDLALTGPAEFPDGEQMYSGKTGRQPLDDIQFVVTGEGKVSATLTVHEVADALPWISEGESDAGRAQNLVELGRTTDIDAAASIEVEKTFAPVISTQVKERVIAQGDPLVDIVTVSVAQGSWPVDTDTGEPRAVKAKVDVYGPFDAPRAATDEGAEFEHKRIGTYELSLTGEGGVETDGSIVAPEEGFYFFHARIDPEDQGDLKDEVQGYSSPFFETNETSVVQWQPLITSQASLAELPEGAAGVQDTITVEGLPEGHGDFPGIDGWEGDRDVIDHYLYFVPANMEHIEGVTEQLEPLAHVQTPAQNGEHTIEAADFPIDWNLGMGTYQVVSEFEGDSRVASVRTSDTETSEQVLPLFGTVRTKAFSPDGELRPGGTIADTVIIEGIFPEGAYTEVDLYSWGNGEAPLCEEPLWSAPRIEHGNKSGEFETEAFVTSEDAEATYGFVERTYDQAGNLISQGECGAEAETLRVEHPAPPAPPEQTPVESTPPGPSSGDQPSAPPETEAAPPAKTPPAKELPRTGAVTDLLVPVGLGLVAAGAGAVFVAMRRK
ncbi:hypothetical protein VR010_11445 [Actinomycetaceae bacterium L2_0104]